LVIKKSGVSLHGVGSLLVIFIPFELLATLRGGIGGAIDWGVEGLGVDDASN